MRLFQSSKSNIHHICTSCRRAWMSVASGDVQTANKFLADLQRAKPSIDLGLQVSRDVLAKMGDPHQATRVVHVAGTNGKGSVCAMVSSALQRAGMKVGTYTSPHIRHWSDAVAINGKSDRDGWARAVSHVETAVGGSKEAAGSLTAFEAATAAMWSQMKYAHVDIAVVETGVGGRLDATNVCAQSEVSVITNIGLDHQVWCVPLCWCARWMAVCDPRGSLASSTQAQKEAILSKRTCTHDMLQRDLQYQYCKYEETILSLSLSLVFVYVPVCVCLGFRHGSKYVLEK
jgi:hypothetical protein